MGTRMYLSVFPSALFYCRTLCACLIVGLRLPFALSPPCRAAFSHGRTCACAAVRQSINIIIHMQRCFDLQSLTHPAAGVQVWAPCGGSGCRCPGFTSAQPATKHCSGADTSSNHLHSSTRGSSAAAVAAVPRVQSQAAACPREARDHSGCALARRTPLGSQRRPSGAAHDVQAAAGGAAAAVAGRACAGAAPPSCGSPPGRASVPIARWAGAQHMRAAAPGRASGRCGTAVRCRRGGCWRCTCARPCIVARVDTVENGLSLLLAARTKGATAA